MKQKQAYKRSLCVLLIAFLALGPVRAQQNYADAKNERKETILYEPFDAANSKWLIPQSKFDNGTLVVSDRLNMITPKNALYNTRPRLARDQLIQFTPASGFHLVVDFFLFGPEFN